MGLLDGVMGSVINPMSLMQLAMGPAGWASMAAQLGQSILSDVIKQVGQQLGMPQQLIDSALQQGGVGGAPSASDFLNALGQQTGASPTQIGEATREANDIVKQLVDSTLKQCRDGGGEGGTGGAGESRLVALARAMGKMLDKKMDQIIAVGKQMDGAKNQGELSAQMQALSQEMSLLSNAMTNVIKSIGEANTTLARKS